MNRSDDEVLHRVANDSLRKMIKVDNTLCLFEISKHSNNKLKIKYLNCFPSVSIHEFVKKYVGNWFDFGTDLLNFYKVAEQDKNIYRLVKNHRGLRMVKIDSLFQALCWAVIGQQINIRFAYKLFRRFIETYGESLTYENQIYWLFPQPGEISTQTVEKLRKLQFTGKKSEYIIYIAKEIVAGNISKEILLKNMDFTEAKKQLLNLYGVGPWTANYVLMRCLGDPNAFPYEDVGLHNAIKRHLNLARKPTIDEIKNMANQWMGWRAYVAFYFYRSLL